MANKAGKAVRKREEGFAGDVLAFNHRPTGVKPEWWRTNRRRAAPIPRAHGWVAIRSTHLPPSAPTEFTSAERMIDG